MKKGSYNLEFVNRTKSAAGKKNPGQKDFLPYLKKAVKILRAKKYFSKKMSGGTILLTLVSDSEIKKINKDYRGKNQPTDVVSLSYFDDPVFPGKEDLTGEIFISIQTSARQAKGHKKTLKQEMQFLFVHGVLHVFGYDHMEAGERKIMYDLQDKVLGTKMWRKIID